MAQIATSASQSRPSSPICLATGESLPIEEKNLERDEIAEMAKAARGSGWTLIAASGEQACSQLYAQRYLKKRLPVFDPSHVGCMSMHELRKVALSFSAQAALALWSRLQYCAL